jgi:hypothetical protein
MHIDVSEGEQGGCHAVQFILKSCAFFLELANYRLHQCFLACINPITRNLALRKFLRKIPVSQRQIAISRAILGW